MKPCLGWQCKCRAISISNETINLTARKQYVATQGAASIITLKAAASESRSSVTVTANFKAWIKGSCHLLLITCYQDCVRSPCPSSESFPAFSWWCLFYYSVPVMSDWLFARNTCVHPAGISMTGPLHSQRYTQLRRGLDVLRDANWLDAGCISFSFVFSHFCHYAPKPILLLPCCSKPSLSFSLSPVWSHCFVGFCPLAISHFLFFFLFSVLISRCFFHCQPRAHIFGYLFPIALLSVLLSLWPCADVRSDRTARPTKRGWIPFGSPVDIKRSWMPSVDP